MTHASLFSGIGGPEVAAAMLGWDNVFHCEINPFGRQVLEYWFPESDSYEDITKTDFTKYRGQIDVLTGGFPCQPFSYAGKRGGQSDDRYLWPEMLRVIDEVRPTWVVGENVAGITTMVESSRVVDMGSEASLFEEDNGIHRFREEQSFTIERVCKDLESKGYSVQPVLIPATAVGAWHRRDRVFFIAHTDCCDDMRGSSEDEGKGGKKRICKRNEVRFTGKSSHVRSEVEGAAENVFSDGCDIRRDAINGRIRQFGNISTGDCEWLCKKEGVAVADTNGDRGGEIYEYIQSEFSDGSKPVSNGGIGDASDSECKRLEGKNEPWCSEGGQWMYLWRNTPGCGGTHNFLPEERWKGFPTVSAVFRGNDGLPFNVDNLTISFAKWRNESIKAYGNAIVPQVMYRIFQCIEKTGTQLNLF